jgi:anaerobic magnesium-protoporphyrin IX monomethyl ester cyclase
MPGPQLVHAVPASRALKRRFPEVPIIWGGYFPSQHAEACLRDPAVDYCVRGQGEHTFLELIRVLTRGGSLGSIQGLSFKDARGSIVHTAWRPLSELDEQPEWPYHRVRMERYLHRHYLGNRVAAHHSSFGCPFACTFCAVVSMAHRRWVAESPDRVARVLARLARDYGADAVQFHDMDFFIAEPRTRAIADRIRPLGLTWWALGRVDELMRYSDETWTSMKTSGLKMVFCGAESGSTETLKRMNKGGTVTAEQTLELARRMASYDVVPEFSFVVGNPPDPHEDLGQTLEFVRRVKAVNPAAEIILYVYSPVPLDGTFYREAQSLGFRFPETLDEWTDERWQAFALRRDPRTPWSQGDIRRRVREFETVLNAYYPTVTDTRLTGARRRLLKTTAAWRYHSRAHRYPIELNLLQRVFKYQRPETTGF